LFYFKIQRFVYLFPRCQTYLCRPFALCYTVFSITGRNFENHCLLDKKSIVFTYHVATNQHKCILILIKLRTYVILTHECDFKNGKQSKITL